MNYTSEDYFDKEITFTYEGKDYLWIGDYTIEQTSEQGSEYAPAYGEIDITIHHTQSLSSYEHGFDVIPSPSILMALELEIERNY